MHKRTGFIIGSLIVIESDKLQYSVEIQIDSDNENPYSGGNQQLDTDDVENLIGFLRSTVRKQKK